MNLSHPEYAILGEDRARVLLRLFILDEPTSGRRIHQLSGVKSLRTTQRILADLVGIGMVSVRSVGSAYAYEANRDHVMWEPIEQVLTLRAIIEERVAEILQDAIGDLATGTALFGSFARGEAGSHSDIDVLIVWSEKAPDEVRSNVLNAAAERIRKLTGNEAQLFPITQSELEQLIVDEAPLVQSLRNDARRLTGVDFKQILKSRAA